MATFLQAVSSVDSSLRSPERPEDFYDALASGDRHAEDRIRQVMTRVRTAGQDGRAALERGWWQKLLYVSGRQWIRSTPRGWQDKRMAKWIPRPVTNECKLAIQTIRAIVTKSQPQNIVRPNGQDIVNVITAQMAHELEPAIRDEHKMTQRWFEMDFWAPVLGTSFFHPHWDPDLDTHRTPVTFLACPTCNYMVDPTQLMGPPLCDTCGSPFVEAIGADGRPYTESMSMGGGKTDVVSALEILIPSYYQRWEDVGELIRYRWRPKSWYEGRPYAHQLQYSSDGGNQLQLFRSLALMTDMTTVSPNAGGAQSLEGCVEAELWIRPCPEYPEGLWMRAAGGSNGELVIMRDEDRGIAPGPLPYETIHGDKLWPWVYVPYDEQGGRIWASGALDGVIQTQDKLNRHDSMVELIMQRMANPIWLEPKGSEVQRFTGEPGQIVRYNVLAGSQAKPERLDGITPGGSWFQLREQYIEDIRRLTGTRDVLQGIQPGGVEAFSALNLLVEQAQGLFTPYFKARGRANAETFLLQLELERTYGPGERVQAVVGRADTWTFKTFEKQRMNGAIVIRVEDGSESPKTSLGQRAALSQGKELGVVPFDDPATAEKTLQALGIAEMVPSLDVHSRTAQTEQEQFVQWWDQGGRDTARAPMRVFSTQNHQIHIQQHDLWSNSDQIRQRMLSDPEFEAAIVYHRLQHQVALQNPFGIPVPVNPMMAAAGADPRAAQPGALPPGQGPVEPSAAGVGRDAANVNQEAGAVDTLPGMAPGGGNMAPPA